MSKRLKLLICLLLPVSLVASSLKSSVPTVVYFKQAKGPEILAARELQRYLYLRTGKLPALRSIDRNDAVPAESILVEISDTLSSQAYQLLSTDSHGLLIIGGSGIAVLYGVYKFLESTGIGFALDEDIIPDSQITHINLSGFNKIYRPAFSLRGIQPFHDFPEGPDWWNEDDYKAIITQLPKMGMNFIGLHTYPEDHPKAEPIVWIGTREQFNADGTVRSAYPVLHFNTVDTGWGYTPKNTSDFSFGASMIFETDHYGADYMKPVSPWPHTVQENIAVFDKVGHLLDHAFTLARSLGVKTCIGTETPLTIPDQEKAYLRSKGKDPESDTVKQEIYEGIFSRIMATHPLDYYWFWTPEGWTWNGEPKGAVEKTEKDMLNAIAAAKKVKAPFTLATCGWVLGPSGNRAAFDQLLPKDMPFSCINRLVGSAPVEPGFGNIQGRPKWAIPWIEDDPGLTSPQFWAGRVMKDALDAYRYGCTGLMGIHWRTKILSPAFMALARAGWEADQYRPLPDNIRDYPADSLYVDWARLQFGDQAAAKAAAIFVKLDGFSAIKKNAVNFPGSANWIIGPGGMKADLQPWDEMKKRFSFIHDLESCRPLISGAGNRQRFEYWLNTFYYAKEQAHVSCLLGEMQKLAKQLNAEKDKGIQKKLAEELLALRDTTAGQWGKMVTYLLETVSTTGGLGTITNLEEHSLGTLKLLTLHDSLLSSSLHQPAPPLNLSKAYEGSSRLIVTTKRTLLREHEALNMKVRVLTADSVRAAVIHWRPLGGSKFKSKPLLHEARKVYDVHLSPDEFNNNSFEYYIEITLRSAKLKYPVDAPAINSTVVVW